MKTQQHIIIIGAGLIGLSSADSLRRRGVKVTIIEREAEPMRGASFANSGMVHLSQAHPWASVIAAASIAPDAASAVLALARRSAPLIAARADALELPMNHRASGCQQIFRGVSNWRAAQARYDALGIEYRRGPAGGVMGDRPSLIFPDDRSGHARDYGMAMAKDLGTRGVNFITGQAALIYGNGRVTGVRCGGDDIRADHVVIAAGMGSAPLAAEAGAVLPMQAIAGYALTFIKPDDLALPDIPVMDYATRSCLTVFGRKVHLSGTVGADSADALLTIWDDIIPGLQSALGAPIATPWRAERPASLSGKPMIGRTAVPGLWVNTGHAHMGWTLCAGSGALLADMMLGGVSASPFSVPALPTQK